MKKLFLLVLIVIPLTVFLPSLSVRASETTDLLEETTGINDLSVLLPDGLTENELLLNTDPDALLSGNIFTALFDGIREMFVSGLREYSVFFISLLSLLILCAVLKTVNVHLAKSAAADTLSLLVLSAFIYTCMDAAFSEAATYLSRANIFMTGMVPVTTALYAVGGNVTTATTQNATLIFALSFLQTLTSTLLLPLLRFCFAFSLVGLVSPVKLGSITGLVKTVTTTLCVFFLTLLSAILFFQSTLSSAADSVGARGVKFLIGLIPVVGNLVGDASKTVASGVTYLRSVIGLFGVVVILTILILPICRLGVRKLFLSLGQTVASVLGLDKEAAFLKESASLLNLLFAILLSSAVYFLLALTIFMKTAVVSG